MASEPVASRRLMPANARALDEALDGGDFERRLLERALDPEDAGASRAWVLLGTDTGRLAIVRELSSYATSRPAAEPRAENAETHSEWDPLVATDAAAEAWREGRAAWSDAPVSAAPWAGFAHVGALRVRLDRDADRLVVMAWDREAPDAPDRFAALAEHARLAARVIEARGGWRSSGEQRNALVEWLRAAASSHHVSEGLRAGARAALRVSGAPMVAIWTVAEGRPPVLVQTAGEARERESLARALQSWAIDVADRATPRVVEPVADAWRSGDDGPATLWPVALERVRRARLFPLIASGQVCGVLAAVDLSSHSTLSSHVLENESTALLVAVADGLAMLLDRAAAADARRTGEQKQRELRARLRRHERLAWLGERAGDLLKEAKQPLASIGAFARRGQRELEEADPRREYLEVIVRECERLERLVAESNLPAEPEAPRLALESLNAVIQDVLPQIGEKLVRRRVRLLKRLDPETPALLLDGERIRQVFRNVLDRAVDRVPIGGRVRVESRLVRDHVIAEIAFDGGHSPGDLLEELFVPFTPEAAHGAPGLGVADRVIRQHGGEVRVRADGEWGAAVLITLPVRGNEDRRRVRSDRRQSRRDRRGVGARG